MKNIYMVIYQGGDSPIFCGAYSNKNYAKDARKICAKEYNKNIDLFSIVKYPINTICFERFSKNT